VKKEERMNHDEYFDFDEAHRTKRRRLFSREVFCRHLDGRVADSGILKFTEKISPVMEDGSSEEIFLEHVFVTDCQCIGQPTGASCVVCGRTFCVNCVQRLKTFCSVCGGFVCGEDFFPGFNGSGRVYCRNPRFSLRRLIFG